MSTRDAVQRLLRKEGPGLAITQKEPKPIYPAVHAHVGERGVPAWWGQADMSCHQGGRSGAGDGAAMAPPASTTH